MQTARPKERIAHVFAQDEQTLSIGSRVLACRKHGEKHCHRSVGADLGRCDWIAGDPSEWTYDDKRVIVVTSHPIDNPKGPLETRSDIDALIKELRALEDGDVWMLGAASCR